MLSASLESVLTMPVFEPYPFGFAMRGGCGHFLSGAFSAFHPAVDHFYEDGRRGARSTPLRRRGLTGQLAIR